MICGACKKWKLLVWKRHYRLVKKDLHGKIILREHITSQSKLCGKCYRNTKKMLSKI